MSSARFVNPGAAVPEQDLLGRMRLVDGLMRALELADPNGALVIGLNGSYGSGKSTILAMLRARLIRRGWHRVVEINPWRSGAQDQLLAGLLFAVAGAVKADWAHVWHRILLARARRLTLPTWLSALTLVALLVVLFAVGPAKAQPLVDFLNFDYAKFAIPVGLTGIIAVAVRAARSFALPLGPLLGRADSIDRIGSMAQFDYEFEVLQACLRRKGRFIVLVDDLDRCDGARLADALSAIAQISAHRLGCRFAFILAYDHQRVVTELNKNMSLVVGPSNGETPAESILAKLVSFAVTLPPVQIDEGALIRWPTERGRRMWCTITQWSDLAANPLYALMIASALGLGSAIWLVEGAWRTLPHWILWGAGLSILPGLVLGIFQRLRQRSSKSTVDLFGWQSAIRDVRSFLPENLRSQTRAMNMGLAAFLLQEAFPGPSLTAWECMTFSAFVVRYPRILNPSIMFTAAPPTEYVSIDDFYHEPSLKTAVEVLTRTGRQINHLTDVEKVKKFVSIFSQVLSRPENL